MTVLFNGTAALLYVVVFVEIAAFCWILNSSWQARIIGLTATYWCFVWFLLVIVSGFLVAVPGLLVVMHRFPSTSWAYRQIYYAIFGSFGLSGLIGGPLLFYNSARNNLAALEIIIQNSAEGARDEWVWTPDYEALKENSTTGSPRKGLSLDSRPRRSAKQNRIRGSGGAYKVLKSIALESGKPPPFPRRRSSPNNEQINFGCTDLGGVRENTIENDGRGVPRANSLQFPGHSQPKMTLGDCLWWIFMGNIEFLRYDMNSVAGCQKLRLNVAWSLLVKYIAPIIVLYMFFSMASDSAAAVNTKIPKNTPRFKFRLFGVEVYGGEK